METLFKALLTVPPLVIAVLLHEIAHGYIAYRLGDPTAKSQGRLTLNPLKHIDPVLTLLIPGLLIISGSPIVFGGAKPVPVNPGYFKNPRRGMLLVAIAGPLTNLTLALVSFILLRSFIDEQNSPHFNIVSYLLIGWIVYSMLINIVLAVFNLIPIPPLDGGRVAVGLLPIRFARALSRVEPYGIFVVILLLYYGVFEAILQPIISFAFRLLGQYPG